MQTATAPAGDTYKYLPSLLKIRQQLPGCKPFGTFKGGFIWELGPGYYAGILLPPIGRAEQALWGWLGEHVDGKWDIIEQWYQDQVEVIHLARAELVSLGDTGVPR